MKWVPPPPGMVKVNVDGAAARRAAVVGVIRDELGNWMGGFVTKIGIADALRAELWSILHGLKLAWDMGFRRVILETDSQLAIHVISSRNSLDPNYNLVALIRLQLQMDWNCELTFAWREANGCAHALAQAGLQMDFQEESLAHPPPWYLSILSSDLNG